MKPENYFLGAAILLVLSFMGLPAYFAIVKCHKEISYHDYQNLYEDKPFFETMKDEITEAFKDGKITVAERDNLNNRYMEILKERRTFEQKQILFGRLK